MASRINTNKKIIEPELSYQIMGLLFDVHTSLGNRYQEKYYQRAVEVAFKKANLSFRKQIAVDLVYDAEKIGKYILDFVVENKVVVELKAVPEFRKEDIRQILRYLKATGFPLGILVNFSSKKLSYKRILNAEAIQNDSQKYL